MEIIYINMIKRCTVLLHKKSATEPHLFTYFFILFNRTFSKLTLLLNPGYYQHVETNHSTKVSQNIPVKVTDFQC